MTDAAARATDAYAAGYLDRWHRRRPASDPSPEYRAGYAAAGEVGAMYRDLGFAQDLDGNWIASGTQVTEGSAR